MANGVSYEIPVPSEYRNAEQAVLANGGLHNHHLLPCSELSQPSSHTDHRAKYAAVIRTSNDREGKNP
jgi:type VI secretion system secreted protein VgrG